MDSIQKLKPWWRKWWPAFLILLLALVALYPQWHGQAAFIGLDSLFHMNRFYDTMMQIKTGTYSYFQSFYGFGQSGRIVNAVYGPAFAYFNGVLLLVSGTWVKYQLVSSLLLFLISGGLMYQLAVKNGVDRLWATLVAITYMFSTPILYWINGQQFTAWGAAFVPLLMLMGTQMMRLKRVAWVKLALAMTLVMQVHNVTSVICALALIPFFITGFIQSPQRKRMGVDLLKAVGLTLLLSANVWAGMLELFTSNHLLSVIPDLNLAADSLYFIHGETRLVYSTTILFLIALLYLIIRWRRVELATKVIILNGALFLWIPSHFFPWRLLSHLVPAVDSLVQNPIRFLVIPYVLLYLALGIVMSDRSIKWGRFAVIGVTALLTLNFFYKDIKHTQAKVHKFESSQVVVSNRLASFNTKHPAQLRSALRSTDLRRYLQLNTKPTPDYLPLKKALKPAEYFAFHPYAKYRKQIIQRSLLTHHTVKNGWLTVEWVNRTKYAQVKHFGLVKYAHTVVKLNGKQLSNVKTSSIGAISVKGKPGVNRIVIQYQSSWWVQAMMWLSFGTWLVIILVVGYRMVSRLRTK